MILKLIASVSTIQSQPTNPILFLVFSVMEAAASNTQKVVLPDAKNGAASMLVAKVADLMAVYLEEGKLFTDDSRFNDLCFSLAKGMDYAIANNEVPIRSRELPPLLKQVYQYMDIDSFPVGLMMLTMSLKCAFKFDWFRKEDTDDLLRIANEVLQTFSDPEQYFWIEPKHAFCWVSYVIARSYPSMRIQEMVFSLELQSGYRFCVASFPIIRGTVSRKHAKMHLFVIRVDNLKASSCIIPPEVNILLNGREIEGRSISLRDKGRQHPVDVSDMLKSGVNCLQTIGQFDGNFLIAIAATTINAQCYDRPSAPTYSAGRSATIQTTRSTIVQQAVQLMNSSLSAQEAKRQTTKDSQEVEMGRSEEKMPWKRRRGSLTGDQAHHHAASFGRPSSCDSTKGHSMQLAQAS